MCSVEDAGAPPSGPFGDMRANSVPLPCSACGRDPPSDAFGDMRVNSACRASTISSWWRPCWRAPPWRGARGAPEYGPALRLALVDAADAADAGQIPLVLRRATGAVAFCRPAVSGPHVGGSVVGVGKPFAQPNAVIGRRVGDLGSADDPVAAVDGDVGFEAESADGDVDLQLAVGGGRE